MTERRDNPTLQALGVIQAFGVGILFGGLWVLADKLNEIIVLLETLK